MRLVHLKFDKEGKNAWFKSSIPQHNFGQLCVAEVKNGLMVGSVDAVSEIADDKISSKVTSILREAMIGVRGPISS